MHHAKSYCLLLALACISPAHAEVETNSPEQSAQTAPYTPSLGGVLGLNTVPNARMDTLGTVRIGTGTMDPYAHGYLGFQIAAPLYVSVRQSAEVSNINGSADRLYPGLDFKMRLTEENRSRPEISLGLQSAIGHKRMAGEYLALSKRYRSFDFTAGLGWGRFGSAGHFDNPLKSISSHFGKRRALDGEMPNEPANWFTGEKVGVFGGIEYFTPLEGLSVKFDWGADRYSAEQNAFDYNVPAPWAIGLSYSPKPWINLAVAAQGTDKLMARLSMSGNLAQWPERTRTLKPAKPMRPYRTDLTLPTYMELSADQEGQELYNAKAHGIHKVSGDLVLEPDIPAPYQIGRAAVHMSNHAGPSTEELDIAPKIMGLQGPHVKLLRRDFEQALGRHQGSAEEIWHNVRFDEDGKIIPWKKRERMPEGMFRFGHFNLTLDNRMSLSEEDSGALYRSSALAGWRAPLWFGFLDQGYALRVNLHDNLHNLRKFRPRYLYPARSNEDDFAAKRFTIDHSWLAATHSFKTDLHLNLMAGYLEEMYAGVGGEILYRPFRSRLAFGAELWDVLKRDPDTFLALGFDGGRVITGHANLWYDLPYYDVTLHAKAGRYLAGDLGGTLALQKTFGNGMTLEGFVTVTDQGEPDLFGGITHAYNGVRLTVPLGGVNKHVPLHTNARFRIEPFGRNIGQSLDKPLPLYEITEPFSYRHMAQHWGRVTP